MEGQNGTSDGGKETQRKFINEHYFQFSSCKVVRVALFATVSINVKNKGSYSTTLTISPF